MHTTVIIPCRPGEESQLAWTLEGFAHQQLTPGHSLEIRVGIDGMEPALGTLPAACNVQVTQYPRMGAAAIRNALVAQADASTNLLIFCNSDTRPQSDMVQQHADAMIKLPANSLILGAAPWERSSEPSIFDALIDNTPMIFSYCHMKPHTWYPFRIAYSLNLSVRREDFVACGGFHDELRPYYYEDLAFACRMLGPEREGVWHEPAAKVLHRHPLTVDQYLDREELLGLMAPILAKVCPKAFAKLLPGRDVAQIAKDFQSRLAAGKSVQPQIYRRLKECELTPQANLGQGTEFQQKIQSLYQLHIPLKLMAFRMGFLRGLDLINDDQWQSRKPQGLWRDALALQ